jgi:heme-degrading monooxygenase HmoA
MAVLMTARLAGGTKELVDGMFAQLAGPQRSARGFILHANGPVADGWRVTEVWDSQDDFEAWFETYVKPALPEGAPRPSITFDELNEVLLAE